MNNTVEVIGDADLVIYMANDEASLFGVIGMASLAVICDYWPTHKHSINEWRPQAASFGGVIIQSF